MDRRRPQIKDLARAYFCSEAVLLEKNEEIKEYLNETKSEFPSIHFDVVHVSVDQENDPRGFKFLVAYAADATFIAFRGSRSFEDLGQESQPASSASDVHGVVQELSRIFIGSACKLFARLCDSGKRIIFCGHRLGGLVAHMVVISSFKDLEVNVEGLEPNTMISIAFGAPNICGYKRAQEINDNAHRKAHFFNVTEESDPVASLQDEFEGLEVKRGTAVRSGRIPIGFTVPLPSEYHQSRSKSIMGSCVPGKIKPWSRKNFSDSYRSAVIAECKLSPKSSDEDDDSPKTKVESPAPHVFSAKWKASEYEKRIIIIITIKGNNLLFLQEPVKLDGLHPCTTLEQKDIELHIMAPADIKAEDIKAVSMVIVKTAFGAAKHVVQEDIGGDSTGLPLRVLPRIIQTFFVLANPPLSYLPSTKTLEDLDSIIQCVPPTLENKKQTSEKKNFSEMLKAMSKGGVSQEDLKTFTKDMNVDINSVIEFLSKGYVLQFLKKGQMIRITGCVVGCLLLAVGLVLLPIGGLGLAVGGAATIATSVSIGGALGIGGGGSIMVLALGKGRHIVREYNEMLLLAITEASSWSIKKSENIQKHSEPPTTAELESDLQAEVERSGSHLESLIEKIRKPGKTNIELSSQLMQAASVESKEELVRRMYIVAKSVAMFNKEVKSMEFLGIVGAEDAGKSTFIMKAIRKFGENPSGDVPEVGFKYHTTIVRPYKLKGSLYLVDFPGSDGTELYAKAWKQFTSLPSSCILLLEFKGDIKKDQVKMYKKKKRDLDSKVAVVFNKVDLVFSNSDEDKCDADYFRVHRVRTAEKLGCNSEDVHYVCLKPSNEQILTELQKMGVLDFEGLAEILLRGCTG